MIVNQTNEPDKEKKKKYFVHVPISSKKYLF